MTGSEAIKAIGGIAAQDVDAQRRLAEKIAEESRAAPEAIVRAWFAAPREEATNPSYVARAVAAYAFSALLESAEKSQRGDARFRYLEAVADAQERLRDRLLQGLARLMFDRLALSTDNAAHGASPPSARVCDYAYIVARRLVAISLPDEVGPFREGEFLKLPEAQRDAHILRWRDSASWSQIRSRVTPTGATPRGDGG